MSCKVIQYNIHVVTCHKWLKVKFEFKTDIYNKYNNYHKKSVVIYSTIFSFVSQHYTVKLKSAKLWENECKK